MSEPNEKQIQDNLEKEENGKDMKKADGDSGSDEINSSSFEDSEEEEEENSQSDSSSEDSDEQPNQEKIQQFDKSNIEESKDELPNLMIQSMIEKNQAEVVIKKPSSKQEKTEIKVDNSSRKDKI